MERHGVGTLGREGVRQCGVAVRGACHGVGPASGRSRRQALRSHLIFSAQPSMVGVGKPSSGCGRPLRPEAHLFVTVCWRTGWCR